MMTVNAMGDACPIPVVKTKKAMETLKAGDVVETYVDNEIAVENLTKMAKQTGCAVTSQKLDEGKYSVQITVSEAARETGNMPEVNCGSTTASNKVVVIRSSIIGEGDPELGKVNPDVRFFQCIHHIQIFLPRNPEDIFHALVFQTFY